MTGTRSPTIMLSDACSSSLQDPSARILGYILSTVRILSVVVARGQSATAMSGKQGGVRWALLKLRMPHRSPPALCSAPPLARCSFPVLHPDVDSSAQPLNSASALRPAKRDPGANGIFVSHVPNGGFHPVSAMPQAGQMQLAAPVISGVGGLRPGTVPLAGNQAKAWGGGDQISPSKFTTTSPSKCLSASPSK